MLTESKLLVVVKTRSWKSGQTLYCMPGTWGNTTNSLSPNS